MRRYARTADGPKNVSLDATQFGIGEIGKATNHTQFQVRGVELKASWFVVGRASLCFGLPWSKAPYNNIISDMI